MIKKVLGAWEQPTNEDRQIIEEQLGRRPSGVIGVAARCRYGRPQAVVNAPLRVNGETVAELPTGPNPGRVTLFPTLYWLTCPMLGQAIGRLESVGWIIRIKEQLQQDPEAVAELQLAHERTARIRRGLIPEETLERLEREYPGQYKVLTASGVAGMREEGDRDALGVKCLHAHFADYLVHKNNPIGRRVWALLTEAGVDPRGWETCFSGCGVACPGVGGAEQPQAVIDVGSNSVRLLVAEVREDAAPRPVTNGLITTRLAAGVTKTGFLAEDAVDRTVSAVRELRERAKEYGVVEPFAIGTSALREAENSDVFLIRAWEEAGVSVRVISGEEEGQLAFTGALATLRGEAGRLVMLCDVGGGSTELIVGDTGGEAHDVVSVPLGAVRLQTLVESGRSLEDCLKEARKELTAGLLMLRTDPPDHPPGVLVAVGGTATTVAALDQTLSQYDPEQINGYRLSYRRLTEWRDRLFALEADERAGLEGMPEGRADIMPYGLAILSMVLDVVKSWTGPEIVVSDNDLMQGVLLRRQG